MDSHSTQLDILIYNSAKYPIFQRFEENVKILEEHLENLDEEEKKFILNSIKKYSKEFYEILLKV